MAHAAAHHEITTIKRSEGQSATARIAYICRTTIKDDRTGETHRYRNTDTELAAITMVGFDGDPATFANALEAGEKRRDGQVGRSSILALPNELTPEACGRVVQAYQRELLDRYGCASVSALHRKPGNSHAHIVENTRDADGKKISVLSNKRTSRAEIEHRRETWAGLINDELERTAPRAERVDHRSLQRRAAAGEKAADRAAVPHLGPALHAVVRTKGKSKRPTWAIKRVRDLRDLLEASEHYQVIRDQVRRLMANEAAKEKAREKAKEKIPRSPRRTGPSLDD